MANPVEMYTDLVGTACLETAFHHSHISETLKHLVMGYSMFSVISVREYPESHTVVRIASDVTDDGSFILLQVAPYDCYIATLDGMHEELFRKIQLGLIVLCHNEKS